MAKRHSKSDMARAVEAAPRAATSVNPGDQARLDLADRIQPALKLSELTNVSGAMATISAQPAAARQLSELNKTNEVMTAISAQQAAIRQLSQLNKTSEVMKAISAQQAAIRQLSELNKTSEMMRTISAHQRITEQVRASLQLPHLEALTKQAAEAAAVLSKNFVGSTGARDIARDAASTITAHIDHRRALPPPPTDRLDDAASSLAIRSAKDMGRLIREAREQRKLSQQAFADLVGVGRRFISELENGKATLEFDKVLQVASACGIDVLARRRR